MPPANLRRPRWRETGPIGRWRRARPPARTGRRGGQGRAGVGRGPRGRGGRGGPRPSPSSVGTTGLRPGTLVPWSRSAVPRGPGAESGLGGRSASCSPRLALVSVPSGRGLGHGGLSVSAPDAPRRAVCAGVCPRPTERSAVVILGVVHGPLCSTRRGASSRLGRGVQEGTLWGCSGGGAACHPGWGDKWARGNGLRSEPPESAPPKAVAEQGGRVLAVPWGSQEWLGLGSKGNHGPGRAPGPQMVHPGAPPGPSECSQERKEGCRAVTAGWQEFRAGRGCLGYEGAPCSGLTPSP